MKTQTSKAIEVIPETAFELFGDHLCRFRQHLINQSYSESTVRQYMRCIITTGQRTGQNHRLKNHPG